MFWSGLDLDILLLKILERKTDFAQLEDFNRKGGDEAYTKKYFENLKNPENARLQAAKRESKQLSKNLDEIYNRWEDTEDTTLMWEIINKNDVGALKTWLAESPEKAFVRSSDGRGPMWWAFEKRSDEIVKILMEAGLPYTDRDKNGKTPMDLKEDWKAKY